MTAVMKLSMIYYLRSYRYWPPVLVVGLFFMFVYSVVPNPVMESYALTSSLIFAGAAWAGYGFVDTEEPMHGALVSLHGGGYRRYWIGRLAAGLVLIVPLPAVVMTLYPIVTDRFERAAEPAEIAAAFAGHLVLGALGFAVAVWFSRRAFAKPYMALFGMFLAVALSLAGEGAAQALPSGLDAIIWLLPPVRLTMTGLNGFAEASLADLGRGFGMPALYAFVLLAVYTGYRTRRGL